MFARSLQRSSIRAGAYVFTHKDFGRCLFMRKYASDIEKTPKLRAEAPRTTPNSCSMLPGGGLEKLQGGLREEAYFNAHEQELFSKMREDGAKLKCENCLENWSEFERVLSPNSQAQLRETSSLSKYKNCNEEAFFLNEQSDCVKLVQEKLITHSNDTSIKTLAKEIDAELETSVNSSINADMPASDALETVVPIAIDPAPPISAVEMEIPTMSDVDTTEKEMPPELEKTEFPEPASGEEVATKTHPLTSNEMISDIKEVGVEETYAEKPDNLIDETIDTTMAANTINETSIDTTTADDVASTLAHEGEEEIKSEMK